MTVQMYEVGEEPFSWRHLAKKKKKKKKEKNQCFPSFSHIQRKCFLFQMEKIWSCYIQMQISTIFKPFQNKK